MAEVTGVLVELVNGSTRTYPQGRSIDVDGYQDYRILDADGNLIATRRRSTVETIELTYAGD